MKILTHRQIKCIIQLAYHQVIIIFKWSTACYVQSDHGGYYTSPLRVSEIPLAPRPDAGHVSMSGGGTTEQGQLMLPFSCPINSLTPSSTYDVINLGGFTKIELNHVPICLN